MATTSIGTNFLDSSTLGSIKGLADDVAKSIPPGLVDRFAALRDRLAAEDFAAARAVIAELRASAGDDQQVLLELGRASLIAESPRDAVQDLERAQRLDREDAEVWFLLGLAKLDLGEDAAAKEALLEAERLLPHSHEIATVLAAVDGRSETAWPTGLRRLIEIHHAHPAYTPARDALADLYLSRALNGWTEVEADGGGMLVSTATKLLRLATGTNIEPGLYATEAKHLKTAADSLQRLQALQIQDREIAARIADLADLVKASGARHLHATWGEMGIGAFLVLGFFMFIGQNALLALFFLASGAGMLVGSFEPQYRSNKVMLMRRGKTVGDAVIGLAQKNQYTAIAYNVMLMGTYPFMAAYKVYMNWGQEWLAKSDFEVFDASTPTVLAASSESHEFEPSNDFRASLEPLATTADPSPEPTVQPFANASAPTLAHPSPAAPAITSPLSPSTLSSTQSAIPNLRPVGAAPPRAPFRPPNLTALRDKLPLELLKSPKVLMGIAGILVLGLAVYVLLVVKPFSANGSGQKTVADVRAADVVAPTYADAQPIFAEVPTRISGRPEVIDTSRLTLNGETVVINGVIGESGVFARQMSSFIQEQGGVVTCEVLGSGLHRCWTGEEEDQGFDLAAAVISNGGGRAGPNAPAEYVSMQATAQSQRRGIWQ